MGIFNRTEQVGTLGVGFSDEMPTAVFVDISGQLESEMYSLLWGQYFLYVLKTIGQGTEVNQFKKELSLWAHKYAPIVARSRLGLPDQLFEKLNYTGLIVNSMIVAKDSGIPLDKLCLAEIHSYKTGIPFFRKLILSPSPFTSTSALSSIMSLAKWVLEQDASFGKEFPRYTLALLKRLDLGDKFHFITTIRKGDKLPAECAHHAFDAVRDAWSQMSEDAKVQRVEVSCPKCGKKHALPSGKSGTVKCLNKECNHQFATAT